MPKPKGSYKRRAVSEDSASPPPKAKKAKAAATSKSGASLDDEGNEYWEISNNRRVTISSFKKMTLVGLREYYEKDGKMLPGKKGIALTIEQYSCLIELLPAIEGALKERGDSVPRPSFSENQKTKKEESEEDDEEEDNTPPPVEKKKKTKAKVAKREDSDEDDDAEEDFKPLKKNFDATSDEDEA